MIILAFFLIILLLLIFIFSSPKISPIPYFPSFKGDLPLIFKSLKMKSNQIIIDLGAGDGVFIFSAADYAFKKKLATKFLAIEINPILYLILFFKRLIHPNKKNIYLVLGDIFKINYLSKILSLSKDLKSKRFVPVFYFYLSPKYLPKIVKRIIRNLIKKIRFVFFISYFYPITPKKNQIENLREIKIESRGKNKVYFYIWLKTKLNQERAFNLERISYSCSKLSTR